MEKLPSEKSPTESLPIILHGFGRMGECLDKQIRSFSGLELLFVLTDKKQNFSFKKTPVCIDFSHAEAFDSVALWCEKNSVPLVSGTTGLSPLQFEKLEKLAPVVPTFWTSNFSPGVFLFGKLIRLLANSPWKSWYIEETHHKQKKDNPSGTAKTLEKIARECFNTPASKKTWGKRIGDVFGIHEFACQAKDEEIKITHKALSRNLFAQAALKVSFWLSQQKPGPLYTMEDFMENAP